jgi:hypothetical protein
MGVVKCTALAVEEECDDLVSVADGGRGLECDGGFIALASYCA